MITLLKHSLSLVSFSSLNIFVITALKFCLLILPSVPPLNDSFYCLHFLLSIGHTFLFLFML